MPGIGMKCQWCKQTIGGSLSCRECGGPDPTYCDACATRRVREATEYARAERNRLAARVDELERAEPVSCSECCRLTAEVARLESMRGAYEEAADAREAREDALADAEEERSELRAKCERLEPEAGALRDALSELVDLTEATRNKEYSPDTFTTQPARLALSRAAGRRALAQIKAGRALAEALTDARGDPGLYRLGQDQATAWEHGSAGVRKGAESDAEAIHARIDAALADWDRAAAGEGGVT